MQLNEPVWLGPKTRLPAGHAAGRATTMMWGRATRLRSRPVEEEVAGSHKSSRPRWSARYDRGGTSRSSVGILTGLRARSESGWSELTARAPGQPTHRPRSPGRVPRGYDLCSPWQNGFVESFNSGARDELFAREIFDSILEAKVLYEDWRSAHTRHHPHSALGFQSPEVFSKTFENPKLSLPLG